VEDNSVSGSRIQLRIKRRKERTEAKKGLAGMKVSPLGLLRGQMPKGRRKKKNRFLVSVVQQRVKDRETICCAKKLSCGPGKGPEKAPKGGKILNAGGDSTMQIRDLERNWAQGLGGGEQKCTSKIKYLNM